MDLVIALLFIAYLFPFVVAARREHERLGRILVANLLLGWTGIGWLVVLRWARRPAAPPPEPVVRLSRGHLRLLGTPERMSGAGREPTLPTAPARRHSRAGIHAIR